MSRDDASCTFWYRSKAAIQAPREVDSHTAATPNHHPRAAGDGVPARGQGSTGYALPPEGVCVGGDGTITAPRAALAHRIRMFRAQCDCKVMTESARIIGPRSSHRPADSARGAPRLFARIRARERIKSKAFAFISHVLLWPGNDGHNGGMRQHPIEIRRAKLFFFVRTERSSQRSLHRNTNAEMAQPLLGTNKRVTDTVQVR